MSGIVVELHSLHTQATRERSHYYVGKVALAAASRIVELERELAEARAEIERLQKYEDEWARMSQDEGKAEREIERLRVDIEKLRSCLEAFAQAGEPVGYGNKENIATSRPNGTPIIAWPHEGASVENGVRVDYDVPLYTAPLPADRNAILEEARQACLRIGDHAAAVGLCAAAIEALKEKP
jgi:hypothetical protein